MKPECRPISFTSPTPLGDAWPRRARRGSTRSATENAVWKPKLWSMNMMSLSIVLGMPTTAILRPALGDLLRDPHRAAERAVAADHEQHVDAHPFQAIDDLRGILLAARRAQDRAAVLVDVGDELRASGRARPAYLAMKPW